MNKCWANTIRMSGQLSLRTLSQPSLGIGDIPLNLRDHVANGVEFVVFSQLMEKFYGDIPSINILIEV